MKPRVLQLFTSGINCDRELRYAFELAGATVREMHIRELMESPEAIRDCEMFAIPGGFTYGDDLGAGRVLGLEVKRFLATELEEHHERGGSIFGVCNGFQALVKSDLLPRVEGVEVSLTWNFSHRFECRWSRLLVEDALDHVLPAGSILPAPSAHAEGQIVLAAGEEDVARLEAANAIALRYCDENGTPTSEWPTCPSGSIGAIAGMVSPSGRILGLMPHPERNLSPLHLPDRGAGAWGSGEEGVAFFRGLMAPYLAGIHS
ncbi:MAG: phosphoribosylformylglycinamidine synthase subunit PurQ [Planctomycetes bacterium]|nr:phosphoribosylformylglycinamidine synthase subunit PurQ [Planctomycetota bacterium]MCP4771642.1 phosphoribosylformylglycinamidine synthase subunit PurQ [Planctomycetota bacterium]MCP4860058.1 phosphoribosylformylglycinamidine synthase subunit PurQ [Planctomycetota bacterium]